MADPNGPVIEALRKDRAWKREELARRVGLSYSGLYNIEKGFKSAAEETLLLIARELSVGLDVVMKKATPARKAPTTAPKPSTPVPPPRPTKTPARSEDEGRAVA